MNHISMEKDLNDDSDEFKDFDDCDHEESIERSVEDAQISSSP